MKNSTKAWIGYASRDFSAAKELHDDEYHANVVLFLSHQSVEKLDEVYTESRYPSEVGILPTGFPTKRQAEEIFAIAQEIFDKVLTIFVTK